MDLQDKLSAVVVAVAGDIKALLMALANKQDKLTSGTNIKTVNGESVLGAGDLVIGGGGAGLTLFAESRNSASPNATVPVHALTALGAEANIDFVIAPKGTGAILAQVPTGTPAGGNKRGTNAADFQTGRTLATQVASGASTMAIGYGNTASNGYAVAMGSVNIASGYCAVAMGSNCKATAHSTFAIGTSCTASGTNGVAFGGNTQASGASSMATGAYTSTRSQTGAISEGHSASSGRQQMGRYPLRWDTTTATPQQLTTDGGAYSSLNIGMLPNNGTYYCRLRVLARNTTTGDSMSWNGTALIKRGANAAATTLIGSTITSDFGDSGMSACTVELSANTTLGALAVIVTGLAGVTVRWVAQLETVEAT